MSTSNRGATESVHFRDIGQRLVTRTAVIESRLAQRLEAVRQAYDLDARALLSSHRQVKELANLGVAPTPIEFWALTANPTGQAMVQAASLVIDEQLAEWADAVERFSHSVARLSTDLGPAVELRDQCAARLVTIQLDPEPINALGRRWQGRLRRTATRRVLPKLLLVSAGATEAIVTQAEVALLDQAPWAHDDRLLSAFELAHADIRVMVRDGVAEGSVVMAGRSGRQILTTR